MELNPTQIYNHRGHSVEGRRSNDEGPFCGGGRKATTQRDIRRPESCENYETRDVYKVAAIKDKLDMQMTLHQGCKSAPGSKSMHIANICLSTRCRFETGTSRTAAVERLLQHVKAEKSDGSNGALNGDEKINK